MRKIAWRSLVGLLIFVLAMGMAGTALAWQFSQGYANETLYGGALGKPWSPDAGTLQGDVYSLSSRVAVAQGYNVRWNPTALSYINSNGQLVSITFHSFGNYPNNSCSTFRADGVGWASNLPNPGINRYSQRPPGCFRLTEIRIFSNSQSSIAAYTNYWGKAQFTEETTASNMQYITVDTYYGRDENYHQKYCMAVGSYTATPCP